jgi:hypothetical protein
MISDDELFELIVRPLPSGCRLTAIFDCCHSGSALDLPFMVKKIICLAVFTYELKKYEFHGRSIGGKGKHA